MAAWYVANLVLGLIISGMLPILLPLFIEGISGDIRAVAWVTGGYNLGLLAAPLLGIAAERFNLYKFIFFTSFSLGV